ncbi:MAG: NIPSNAP family protein [Pirellulaceae bacterium]|nr:NIPSNAP family protein [Planctomycetaceae bacterium]MDG2385445.1 NIPSNAP family protein [Pirellulaceae bacterium]
MVNSQTTKQLAYFLSVCAICTLGNQGAQADDDSKATAAAKSPQVFEQRIYTTADGKLPNLHSRFRDHTNYLFVKHGMHLIGYWTPKDKPNTLIYILAYPNQEAREASWKAFMSDPEWQRVWAESKENAGGSIVTKVESIFMTPTDYSPIR